MRHLFLVCGIQTVMNRMLLGLALVFGVASVSEGAPFRIFNRNTTTNTSSRPVVRVFLGSAQAAANHMASMCRMGHFGNPTGGYEGVGMGSSPNMAISNCCYYGKRPLRDSGVAQGSNGMWYACCRYN